MTSRAKVQATQDPREAPTYALPDAARYLKIAPATLRSWVRGRTYPVQDGTRRFRPLIELPDPDESYLSFANLVEAHVLRALRTEHGLSIRAVRTALDYAKKSLGIQRLLLSTELRTHARDVLLERYGNLVNLSRSGQLAMQRVLAAYLERIVWDELEQPLRLYPFLGPEDSARIVVIDPRVSFGRPVVASRGITTEAIAQRIDAGEAEEALAADYGLDPSEIYGALVFERAAA